MLRSTIPLWTGLILLFLVAAPSALAQDLPELPSADDPIDVDALTRAARVLTLLLDEAEPDLAAAAADLADGGPDMIPCLLVLRHRFSGPEVIEATTAALARLGSREIESYLHFHLGTSRDPAVRCLVYRLLAEHGTLAGTAHLIAAMQADGPEEQEPARRALAATLARPDAAPAYARIREAWEHVTPGVRGRLVASLADADTQDSLETLKSHLGTDVTLDPILLAALARMETHGTDLGLVEAVEKATESPAPMVRKMAVAALGRLEDPAVVPRLIDLLESGEEGLQKDAHWALRNISGMRFPANPELWRAWYEREMNWWWTEGQELLEDLRSEDDRVAVRAMLLFTRRPFFRRAVEGELVGLAEAGSEKARIVATHALGKLGLSEDPSSEFQREAAKARLLDPSARPETVVGRKPAPPIHIGPGAGLPLPVLILGFLCICWLVWRIFGRSLPARFSGMREWVSDPGRREGPMTITVERRPRA